MRDALVATLALALLAPVAAAAANAPFERSPDCGGLVDAACHACAGWSDGACIDPRLCVAYAHVEDRAVCLRDLVGLGLP